MEAIHPTVNISKSLAIEFWFAVEFHTSVDGDCSR